LRLSVATEVFPGGPVVSIRSDLQLGNRRQGARAHDLPVRHGDDQAGMGAGLHLRHRPARPRRHATRQRLRFQSMTKRTPSQTVGPYLHLGLTQGMFGAPEVFGPAVADAGVPGTHIRSEGRVLDGEGSVLPDALIETWQADGEGRYAHPADGRPPASNSFRGFGRCPTA